MGELKFIKPVRGDKGDGYGKRRGGMHYGIDYLSAKGTPVAASERGLVVRAADNPKTKKRPKAFGNTIIIDHTPWLKTLKGSDSFKDRVPSGARYFYTLYAHLDKMYVKRGDYVDRGEVIGLSGNTGSVRSSEEGGDGSHLHFESIVSDSFMKWAKGTGATGIEGDVDRKDPDKYINTTTASMGTAMDFMTYVVSERIDFDLDIDWKRREPVRLTAFLFGKPIGFLGDNGKITVASSFSEIHKAWKVGRLPEHVKRKKMLDLKVKNVELGN